MLTLQLVSDADKIGFVRDCFCYRPSFCDAITLVPNSLYPQMFLGSTTSLLVPIEIAIIIWLIYDSLGPATFAGLGVILLMLPVLGVILAKLIGFHTKRLQISDKRVKLSSEILQGIRILKFYGETLSRSRHFSRC